MIEMLGVLAIIGVLSVGGIMGYSVAMENYRVNKTLNDMREMAMKTQTLLANYGTSSTNVWVDAHKLHQVGIIPDDYYSTITGTWCNNNQELPNCTMKSPVSDNTWIAYLEYFYRGQKRKILYFRFYGVPYSACVKIATADWSNLGAAHSVLLSLYDENSTYKEKSSSLDRATAEKWCTGNNSLRFIIDMGKPKTL